MSISLIFFDSDIAFSFSFIFYTIGLESLKSVSAASIAGRSLSASTMRTRRMARGPTQPWVSDHVIMHGNLPNLPYRQVSRPMFSCNTYLAHLQPMYVNDMFSVAVASDPTCARAIAKTWGSSSTQFKSSSRLRCWIVTLPLSLPLFNNHGSGKSVSGCLRKIILITLCSKIANFIPFLLPGLLTE